MPPDEDFVDTANTGEVDQGQATETQTSEPTSVREAMERAFDEQSKPEGERQAKPETAADGRQRDEQGRFSPKEAEKSPPAKEAGQQAAQATQAATQEQPQVAAPVSRPPSSWPEDAKAAFGQLPSQVQAAVAKREAEVENGFRILQNYKGLEQFQEYADRAGMPQSEIMRRAVEWEKATLSDPIGTVRHILSLRGVDPRLAAQALLNPNMPTPRIPQPQAQQQQQPRPIDVRGEVEKMFREREVSSSIDKFMSDPANVHAEAVAPKMAGLIQAGLATDLPSAYQMAIWADPQIRETLIRQGQTPNAGSNKAAQAANQARAAAKAVTGAPSRGQSPANPSATPKSTREAIEMAYEAVAG